MKAYINGLGIEGYDEKTNHIDGWGTGRLEAEDENIPGGTEVEIIGHTMMLSPKNKFHDDEYEPVVIVAYNNPEMWKDGDKYRRIAYLPACCLLLENASEPIARQDGTIKPLVHDEFFKSALSVRTSVLNLCMSTRLCNLLMGMGCMILEDVLRRSPNDFKKVRGFGEEAFNELMQVIEKSGHRIGELYKMDGSHE